MPRSKGGSAPARGASQAMKNNISASVNRRGAKPKKRTVRGDVQAQNFVGGLTPGA
jgi:hypothetical protein